MAGEQGEQTNTNHNVTKEVTRRSVELGDQLQENTHPVRTEKEVLTHTHTSFTSA